MSATHRSSPERKRYGMVFDLDACVGCQTCTIACKQTNQTTPGVLWRNVLDFEVGEYPKVDRTFLLTGCQHCDNPSCVPVCPTGATYKRDDGLVVIDYDICIGCSSCAVACPYQARKIEKNPPAYYKGERMPTEQRPVQLQRVGVAQKCSFCKERVDDGLAQGLVPGVDPDATPACANACISQAITFGDFADPQSLVNRKLRESGGGRQMHESLNNRPHIFYIGERQSNEVRPGPLQTHWDMRAAMNFIMGGMSSALFLWSWMAHALGFLPYPVLRGLEHLAAALMSIGLFFVFLKLGRKMRFWRVITRWRISWMTRETWCVGLIFGALMASWLWPMPLWDGLMAMGGAVFLWCQAKILHTSRGIPAWRHEAIPALLCATGLLEGAAWLALALVVLTWTGASVGAPALALCGAIWIVCGVWMLRLWSGYTRAVRADTKEKLEPIRAWVSRAGHLPAIAIGALLLGLPTSALIQGLALVTGIAIVAMGALMKYQLIVRASYFQGFQIPPTSATAWKQSPALA